MQEAFTSISQAKISNIGYEEASQDASFFSWVNPSKIGRKADKSKHKGYNFLLEGIVICEITRYNKKEWVAKGVTV